MLIPRNTLLGTRADGQLLRSFWANYVKARLLGADDEPLGGADRIFEESILFEMRRRFQTEVLLIPVFFTERLSNRILAGCITLQNGTHTIGINARFKVDPEIMAHSLVEEFVHVQQIFSGTDFEAQRRSFTYDERPYEREAKAISTEILGYQPSPYEAYLLREEPSDILG